MANIKHVNSVVDRDFRNRINQLIDVVNSIGTSLNDLVVKGVMTTEQYSQLLTAINGLVKIGEVDLDTLSVELKTEIEQINNKVDKGNVSVADINKNLGKLDQTFLSDELLQQIAGTAPINAVPADLSITTDKMAYESITPEKTTFTEVGSNKFNKDDVVRGYHLNNIDGIIVNETNSYSNYIYLPNVTEITVARITRINFYDKDKKLISSFAPTSTISETVSVPSGTVFIRVNVHLNNLDLAQINVGDTLLRYEEYAPKLKSNVQFSVSESQIEDKAVTVAHTNFIKTSSNLFNKHDVINGSYLDTADKKVDSSSYSHSNFIDVFNVTEITFKGISRLNLYNKDKKIILSTSYDRTKSHTVEIPINAYFIRVNFLNTDLDTVQINQGDHLLKYEDFYYDFIYSANQSVNNPAKHIVNADKYFNTEEVSEALTQYSLEDLYARYEELRAAFPEYISRQVIKNDLDGNPIYRYDFKPTSVDPTDNKFKKIFITTGTHGGEKASIWVTYLMFKHLCENWLGNEVLEELRTNVHFVVIPVVNPFSYLEFTAGTSLGRKNKNGVDILRNFPVAFKNARPQDLNPDASTYRGVAPLSELEAQAVYNVYKEGGWDYVTDFHNFFSHPNTNYFLWIPGTDEYTQQLAKNFIRKISVKWKKDIDYFPKDASTYFGYSDLNNVGIHEEAHNDGIPATLLEICQKVMLEPVVASFSDDVITLGTEAVTNWLYHVYLNV